MSQPVLPDGVYKILNAQNPSYAVDLIYGLPNSSLSGYVANNNSDNQQWLVRNIDNGQLVFESVAAPGSYAGSNVQKEGAPLCGSVNPTIFTIRDLKQGSYQILTTDGQLLWLLPNMQDYVGVVLQPSSSPGANAQWTFTRIQ